MTLIDTAYRILLLPSVADKTFLITIGDRSIGGMTARDQMVGPWQVPVADVAVTSRGFQTNLGEAFAIGERTPLALIDPVASARMAVGEGICNIAAALIDDIEQIKLSANWMAAAGHPGVDAGLYDAVRSVGMELCPQLGMSIPVGKDSMSMKTTWQEIDPQNGEVTHKEVIAPLSLIVSAFASVTNVRQTLTPLLRMDCGATELLLIDLGAGQNRLGGSALTQVYKQVGNTVPNIDGEIGAKRLTAFFNAIQRLNRENKILAYHDRSDGGLFVTLCEEFSKSFQYWLPMVCLYTGARIEEPASILLRDVKEIEGTPAFFLSGDGNQGGKNDAAPRWVPIHPGLIRAGFLDYVAVVRAEGHEFLFPDIYDHPRHGRTHEPSNFFTEYRRSVGVGKQKGEGKSTKAAHSFRSTLLSAPAEAEVSEDVRKRIVGHAASDVHGTVYDQSKLWPQRVAAMHSLSFGLRHPTFRDSPRFRLMRLRGKERDR